MQMIMTCFRYMQFCIKWIYWMMRFCYKIWYFSWLNNLTPRWYRFRWHVVQYNKSPVLFEGSYRPCHIFSFLIPLFWYCLWISGYSLYVLFPYSLHISKFFRYLHFYILIVTLDFLSTSFYIFYLVFWIFVITNLLMF